jgi:hypothetical protein
MSATGALSNKQFNTERSMLEQGNMDELATRVRGIQNLTSNVYRPAFSSDYATAHRQPSGTAFGEGRTGGGMEEEEDEEA